MQELFEEPLAAECADALDRGPENNHHNPRKLRLKDPNSLCDLLDILL